MAPPSMPRTPRKSCTFCHEKVTSDKEAMKANSDGAGKYYKDKKTLDGYTAEK